MTPGQSEQLHRGMPGRSALGLPKCCSAAAWQSLCFEPPGRLMLSGVLWHACCARQRYTAAECRALPACACMATHAHPARLSSPGAGQQRPPAHASPPAPPACRPQGPYLHPRKLPPYLPAAGPAGSWPRGASGHRPAWRAQPGRAGRKQRSGSAGRRAPPGCKWGADQAAQQSVLSVLCGRWCGSRCCLQIAAAAAAWAQGEPSGLGASGQVSAPHAATHPSSSPRWAGKAQGRKPGQHGFHRAVVQHAPAGRGGQGGMRPSLQQTSVCELSCLSIPRRHELLLATA